MKALRVVLTQSSANYKKEETVTNKMTYPLPPFSTVIGAIHVACNYKDYHPMNLSIQGNFESMHKKMYIDHCFLNSVQKDRGILVKMKNETLLSTAFEKVACAKKARGSNFIDGTGIEVYNEELLNEYRSLKKDNKDISKFKSLTTSVKYYEILNNIKLIIHISSDDKTLAEIQENIYKLKSIGRSEDFVDVEEVKLVELQDVKDTVISNYSAYLNYEDIKNENIFFDRVDPAMDISGTKYYLNKNYHIDDNKRKFEKTKVLYASHYCVDSESKNIFIDNDVEKNIKYIVNLI